MPVVEKSITIRAPVEKVFAVVDDPNRLQEYMVGITRTTDIVRTSGRIGDSVRFTYSVMGLRFPGKATTLEWKENQRIVVRLEGGIGGTFTATLQPEGASTRVNWHFDYTMRGGILGKAANALLVERMNERNVERGLENLKMLCEARDD
ncbi:MAG: SRPBCC family protein [Dehalococcoidia bacterium]